MRGIRNIGLAAVAALALSAALGATSASAAEFEAEQVSTTIGSSGPYGLQTWQFHTAQQDCDALQLAGALSIGTKKLETTAKDAACYDNFTGFELKTNGCGLVHRLGVKTGATTFSGSVDISCPAGKTISFVGGVNTCKVNVPGQNNLPATYENVGAGKERAIKVTVNASGLKHSQVSGSDCGGAIGTYSDGTWSGSWKLQGSSGGSPVGIWVKASEGLELPPSGIAISGSPSALVGGTYPITVTGQQKGTSQHIFELQWGSVKCNTALFSSSISGASTQFAVSAEYGGCTWGGFPASVKMNGCTYTFNVLNGLVGSLYAGHADIACPAGKAIELVATSAGWPKCTATVQAQSPNEKGLSFTNEPSTSTIGLVVGMQGVDYHQQEGGGLGRCSSGDFTNGYFSGVSTLAGSY